MLDLRALLQTTNCLNPCPDYTNEHCDFSRPEVTAARN